MSFAVELPGAAPAIHWRLRVALAAFAIAAIIVAAWAGETKMRGWSMLAVLIVLPAILLRIRMSGLGASQGLLRIDDAGNACWRAAGNPVSVAVRVRRWHVAGRFAWLEMDALDRAVSAGEMPGNPPGRSGARGRFDVLFWRGAGASAAPDEAGWRRLCAWLRWYGRGMVAAGAPGVADAPTVPAAPRSGPLR